MDIMEYISSLFNYIKAKFINPIDNNQIEIPTENKNDNQINNQIDINQNYYIFINTANIYQASDLMFDKLKTNEYNNKSVSIYLLKSHNFELLCDKIIINDDNLEYIKHKLSKKRRHLHTFIDAIYSFIEYNNIKNYHIYY
jgi:hypothetical protein